MLNEEEEMKKWEKAKKNACSQLYNQKMNSHFYQKEILGRNAIFSKPKH
jgi:hypothetical protein